MGIAMSTDEDKAAVLAVLVAENAAFMRRDLDAWAEYWVHSPQSRFMISHALHGSRVLEGWDAIKTFFELGLREITETYDETRVHLERMNVVVSGDMAWATYDQVGDGTGDKFYLVGTYHQLQIFQRIAGQWKISCIVVMQRATDHEICPLIEVASDKRVLWMNTAADEQIANHPALVITGGRLRARNRSQEASLQEAVDWASQLIAARSGADARRPAAPRAPSILGEDEDRRSRLLLGLGRRRRRFWCPSMMSSCSTAALPSPKAFMASQRRRPKWPSCLPKAMTRHLLRKSSGSASTPSARMCSACLTGPERTASRPW